MSEQESGAGRIRQPARERDQASTVTNHGGRRAEPSGMFSAPDGARMSRSEFFEKLHAPERDGGQPNDDSTADDELGAALSDPERGSRENGDSNGDESQHKPELKTLNDLAETLGVAVKDLYAITFPMAEGGTPRSIGELKDILAKEVDFESRSMQWEETRTKTENELLRAREDLRVILQSIPKGTIKPEVLAKAQAEATAYREQEAARTLEVIPEWSKDETKTADREAMLSHMQAYGFTKAQLEAIVDHRMLKYIRDNMLRERRVAAALEKVNERTKGKGKGNAPSRRNPGGRPSGVRISEHATGGKLRDRIAGLNSAAARTG